MSKKLVQSKAILNSLLILKFPFWFNFTTIKRSIRVLTHKVHLSDRTNWYWDLCTRVQTFVHAHLLSTKTLSQDGEFLSFQFTIYNNTYSLPFAKNPSPPCIQICLSGKFMLRDIPCKYSAHEFTFSSIFGLAEKCRGRKDGNILGRAGVWTTINNAALRPKKVKRHWMMVRHGCW